MRLSTFLTRHGVGRRPERVNGIGASSYTLLLSVNSFKSKSIHDLYKSHLPGFNNRSRRDASIGCSAT